jgi:hypothetical protein
MIYAKAILGPIEQPNGRTIVRILTQLPTPTAGWYACREVGTNKLLTIPINHLELFWMEDHNAPATES